LPWLPAPDDVDEIAVVGHRERSALVGLIRTLCCLTCDLHDALAPERTPPSWSLISTARSSVMTATIPGDGGQILDQRFPPERPRSLRDIPRR
jgi:hypothetical protein